LIDALMEGWMNRRIDAHMARTQFGQVIDRAVTSNERFIVDRRGKPVVVILSVQDYLASVQNAPEWLREAWAGANQRGLDKLTMDEIDAEIDAYRREKKVAARAVAK
jgi:prevent-host-death family protein